MSEKTALGPSQVRELPEVSAPQEQAVKLIDDLTKAYGASSISLRM